MTAAPGNDRSLLISQFGRSNMGTPQIVFSDSWIISSNPSPAHSETITETTITNTLPPRSSAPARIWAPITGIDASVESIRSVRNSEFPWRTRPTTLTNASSSGNTAKNPR